MSVKVSELTETKEVHDEDYLMIVQDGVSKKVNANIFQQAGESAENAQALEGYKAEDFVKSENGISYDSDRLGGIESASYATKDYVDQVVSTGEDYVWACPRPWFRTDYLPDQISESGGNSSVSSKYMFCNGQSLSRTSYSELYNLIGLNYTRTTDGDIYDDGENFCLPNLNGKFILGANVSEGNIDTGNLPYGLYSGKDFTDNGQYRIPKQTGWTGGDPTTCQDSPLQMITHNHSYESSSGEQIDLLRAANDYACIGDSGSDVYVPEYKNGSAAKEYSGNTCSAGGNQKSQAVYPPQAHGSDFNYGMLSMPPYLTFAWIIRVKP